MRFIAKRTGTPTAELRFPTGTLGGLQAELLVHLHQHAFIDQILQQSGQLLAEIGNAGLQVITQQVGQVIDMGADTETVCPYCSTLYRFNAKLKPNEAIPAQAAWAEKAA